MYTNNNTISKIGIKFRVNTKKNIGLENLQSIDVQNRMR